MKSHLDPLIQRLELITQQLKMLEIVFAASSLREHKALIVTPETLFCQEANSPFKLNRCFPFKDSCND
ncbi:MAG: hypothetical protein SFY66_08900 [Oculatellaceae cyanobacterium bins.114]|nr:hypothetical protein [Oculatellaceae cyanobacterium bins.114]